MLDLIKYLPIVAVIILLAIIVAMGYVKAPPDMAYIISGIRPRPRVLIGRAGVKIPFFERVDMLYLGQMTVDIKTEQSVPTNDFINVDVDAVAKVRIGTTDDAIQLAAKNFLNKSQEQIATDLQDSLQGNMREIIGTLSLKAINTDRDSFSDQVMEKASKDMEKLGIEILSCNIQNVTDENNLIKDLGADNTSKIKKDAAIAKAVADKEVAIAQAEANRAANDARVAADTDIAQKNNALEIKKAELKQQSDNAKAIADAAYDIQNQEQQKSIQTATVNAQIARTEREAELKAREVEVQQQTLVAQVNKQADAEKYARERQAEAELAQRQRKAEAELYEQERQADAQRKQAEAKKYAAEQEAAAVLAKAQAEAAGVKAKGEAEAAAVKARGIAEAEAVRAKGLAEAEAMQKKADAYERYGKAAVLDMVVKIMPDMAKAVAAPLGQIDKINVYGGNGGSGADQISGNVPIVMQQVFDTMSEATGVNFADILKAQTYDAKVNKNVNVTGLDGVQVQPAQTIQPAKTTQPAQTTKTEAEAEESGGKPEA